MSDINKLVNKHILNNIPKYQGVETSTYLAQQAGVSIDNTIRLNANENPFGVHPCIQEAIKYLPLNVYPDQHQRAIRNALASYVGVSTDMVIAGSGTDELIDLIVRVFVAQNDKVVDFTPTFGMYNFLSKLSGAEVVHIQRIRAENWRINTSDIHKADITNLKVIFLASPNNPTGNLIPEEDLHTLLQTGVIVVVDETYYEFSSATFVPLLKLYNNLIVLRSFSKWAGIAGLRIGYAITSQPIVSIMMSVKQPYNVNVTAEAAALAALSNLETLFVNVHIILEQREYIKSALDEMDGVEYWESSANFILCKFTQITAERVYEELKQNGIFVRRFYDTSLTDTLRVSVGTPMQNIRFLNTLQTILKQSY